MSSMDDREKPKPDDATHRVGYRAANKDDAHRAGCPPAEPDARRDSLGRRISEKQLAALKSGQYQPGESGNPAGRFSGRGLQEAIRSQMRKNQLRSTDPIESLLDALDAG